MVIQEGYYIKINSEKNMEKSQFRVNYKKIEQEERENRENEKNDPFNFEEVVKQGSTALIFEDANTSIYHAYLGLN